MSIFSNCNQVLPQICTFRKSVAWRIKNEIGFDVNSRNLSHKGQLFANQFTGCLNVCQMDMYSIVHIQKCTQQTFFLIKYLTLATVAKWWYHTGWQLHLFSHQTIRSLPANQVFFCEKFWRPFAVWTANRTFELLHFANAICCNGSLLLCKICFIVEAQ